MATQVDLVVDFVAPRNRNVRFYPAGRNFRGEVRIQETAGSTPAALIQVGGVIPGQRMLVDSKRKYVKVIDRMTLKENQMIDRELRRLCRTERYWNFAYEHYEEDVEYNLSDNDWRQWLWWIKRLVDHGRARIVQGKLPVADGPAGDNEILKMGRFQFGDSCGLVPIDKDRPFYMADERDIEHPELMGVGA